ncbi:MAG: nitroreductase family protein, partial [Prevotella sp.]|nr:nitroreductase family protein [Prevotella sp.]
ANTLVPVSDKNIIDALVAGQQFVKDAPMTLLLVSDQSNSRRKNAHYGDIDTGYVSQNIYLACTALGLKTVARAMMDQDAIRTALNFSEDIIIELNHPIGY